MFHYNPHEIEPKWQKQWEDSSVFTISNDATELKSKPKYYVLDMFPYPSGAGLHVGHPEGYTATDVVARYKRMRGFNVLHPMGWDAFGLPAERAAMRDNEHPATITERNVDNFRRQIKRLGFSYDWSREVSTSSPDYYKWTQWIFLKLYEKGLAYMAEVPVNWCPALGTVLANEEVKDGVYVETGDPVERRLMKQWMLRITAYAERLITDLEDVDWPEGVKEMQRNWIGRSIGADIKFQISDSKLDFTVFTTRPDTLFGATYCVLAPEHELVLEITTPEQLPAVKNYIREVKNKTDLARTDLAKEKSGVFTGAYALHPITGKQIPIWIADYVLITYGSGAIMAVPAHDERDHEFATAFKLPIIEVISGGSESVQTVAYSGDGKLVNSDFINGLNVEEAKTKIINILEQKGVGESRVQYRLRDWLFSRQRYWGEPFPIAHIKDEIIPLPVDSLPITLPVIDEYRPTEDGAPPLARAGQEWLSVTLPDGRIGQRETNTMPQWAGSCWYYLRYMDPKNSQEPWSQSSEQYWMPVDLYVGGVEHAVLHLLYARFWHKVLYDCGLVHTKEPFQKLFNQGMILAYSYRDSKGKYYHPSDVRLDGDKYVIESTGEEVETKIEKMSKSKQNVVNPDEVIDKYGADAMRLYELFMGPLEQVKPWQMDGVEGVYRFLARVWRLYVNEKTGEIDDSIKQVKPESEEKLWKLLHQTIKKVADDTENMRFNTAISQMMIFINEATSTKSIPLEIAKQFVQILSPYAPHLCEELWQKLNQKEMIATESWPNHNEALCVENNFNMVVQVNGKLRDSIELPVDISKDDAIAKAMTERVKNYLDGKAVVKSIYVPKRLVNFVVK